MKYQRFKPSTTSNNGGHKEKHKVTITRKFGTKRWGRLGNALKSLVLRLLKLYRAYLLAEPYLSDLLTFLQQFM